MITKNIIKYLLSDQVDLYNIDYQLRDDLSELYIPDPFKTCKYRCFPLHQHGWAIRDLETILENLLKAPKVYIKNQIPIKKYEFDIFKSYFYGDEEAKAFAISVLKNNHNVKHLLYGSIECDPCSLYELNNPTINDQKDFYDLCCRKYYDLSPIILK